MLLRFRVQPPATGDTAPVERAVELEPTGDEIAVGRQAGVAIELPFATVSARHARFVRRGDGWAIVDLGSANGTFVGDRRLPPRGEQLLREGDVLRFADVTVVFEGGLGAKGGGGAEGTGTLARRLVSDLFGAARLAEVPRIFVEAGPDAGLQLALETPERPYKVGRSPQCDLVLADDDVSREHAAFVRRWQGVYVSDLGSKNGIEVAAERVAGERRLQDGDIIVIGRTRLRVEDPEGQYLKKMQEEKPKEPEPVHDHVHDHEPISEQKMGPKREGRVAQVRGPLGITVVAVVVLVGIAALALWLVLTLAK